MNKVEARFQKAVRELGCIVCRLEGIDLMPCDVHHILHGSVRKGEMFVLGLCHKHHRSGACNNEWVSRHPWRTRFVRRYGTEEKLLEITKELITRIP